MARAACIIGYSDEFFGVTRLTIIGELGVRFA